MILCPNCKHQELEGSIFCSECGAQLVSIDRLSTQAIRREPTDRLHPPPAPKAISPAAGTTGQPPSITVVSLHFVDRGEIIRLRGNREYTLGRKVDGQSSAPEIDLTPMEAYANGVSRVHASLRITSEQIFVTDLGSSNGTRLNGSKISPNVEHALSHGDLITLGKLKIQVLIQKGT